MGSLYASKISKSWKTKSWRTIVDYRIINTYKNQVQCVVLSYFLDWDKNSYKGHFRGNWWNLVTDCGWNNNIASILNVLPHTHTHTHRLTEYFCTKIKGHCVCNWLSSKWSNNEQKMYEMCYMCLCVFRDRNMGRDRKRENLNRQMKQNGLTISNFGYIHSFHHFYTCFSKFQMISNLNIH